jgi:hypothetical protein
MAGRQTRKPPSLPPAGELLVRGKQKVRDSRSVKKLQTVLNTLGKEYSSIDFTPAEMSVKADEFVRANTNRASEVAYLLGSGKWSG